MAATAISLEKNQAFYIYKLFQLCIPAVLHKTGSVGHWLCDCGWTDSPNHPTKQITVSGSSGWTERGIVSILRDCKYIEGL